MNRNSLETFIETYGRALSSGELEDIADCWEIPSLVLSDQGAVAVHAKEDVMGSFERAVAAHKTQGRTSTIGEIISKEYLSKNLVAVDVRWPSFDDQGKARSVEMSHYLLRVGEDGKPRIQVALTRSVG
jgi:hypothetical protein